MIELPKYTIPTYAPRGLAVDERTDFTRRIPALPEMQVSREQVFAYVSRRGEEEVIIL